MLGVLLVLGIAVVGGIGIYAQARGARGGGATGQEALFERLAADTRLADSEPGSRDRLEGFTLGRIQSGGPSDEVIWHIDGLVTERVPVTASLGGTDHAGRIVKLHGAERLVFRPDSAATGPEPGQTASLSYRALGSLWSFLADLRAVGRRGDWALDPPRTIQRREGRAQHRLPLKPRVLTVLTAGDLAAEELPVVDLSEAGLAVLSRSDLVTLVPGEDRRVVLRLYGERLGDFHTTVRHVAETPGGVVRGGLSIGRDDAEARALLRKLCQAVRRAGRLGKG